VAFVTMSEDKEEPKKAGKKKEVTCFRSKNIGHYTRDCNEELPSKTPKSRSNMSIADKESSQDEGQDMDDEDEQYNEESKYE